MEEHRARIREQFGRTAEAYVSSPGHAAGADLDRLVSWAEGGPDKTALDVATGGGHTALALAPLYGRVVATDITERMLGKAAESIRSHGVTNVEFVTADAEDLPFPDASFDAVSCRIAPHHFPHPERFVAEVARVLEPGGIFLLEDTVVPEGAEGEGLNWVEWLRDPTHLRSLTVAEWCSLLEGAGLEVEAEEIDRKRHEVEEWMERSQTDPERREAVRRAFQRASPAAREAFVVEYGPAGAVISYTDEKLLLKARRG